jgi:hypothetical protein
MQKNIDFIHVPKADINEGITVGIITKAALYFTKAYLFVLPFESFEVLLAGTKTKYNRMQDYVLDLNTQMKTYTTTSFEEALLNNLKPERVYKISELDKFTVQVGFWIFGGLQIRKRGGPLQAFNVQPKALRQEIKTFYGI